MRVLFVQNRANKAGAQVCLALIIKALKGSGIETKVIIGEEGWLSDRLRILDVLGGIAPFPSLRSLPSRLLKLGPFMKAADIVWKTHGPFHIINANDTWDALLAEKLALKWKIPWIVHLRSITTPEQPHQHYLKYHCNKADAAVAVSPSSFQTVLAWDHRLLEYIPEGLSEDTFSSPYEKEILFPYEIGVVGHSGTIKGWADIAAAFKKVKERRGALPRKIHFFGKASTGCQNEIREEMPSDIQVVFEGHVDNLTDYLRSLDLVISPSRQESFGMSVLEAIAAGTPVLASRTGIVPDIMGCDSPWTFLPGNPEHLAITWMNIPSFWNTRNDYLLKWQEIIIKDYSIDALYGKLVKLYRKVLELHKS
ncbi:MAG: glycosyltransferase family 4 protein [Nitrospirota bacterium]